MQNLTEVLNNFISSKISRFATSIFFQLFNGVEAMFSILDYRLESFKKNSNLLTADNLASLRNLASNNGFEPTLKIPSMGILLIQVSPTLFGRVGFPLFINSGGVFENQESKLNYFYIDSKSIRITSEQTLVPVVEGYLKSEEFTSSGDYISRFYLSEADIAQNSVSIISNGLEYVEVKSFYDNENLNNNRQFIVKFSNDTQTPIVVYVKGLENNQIININYRLTSGELGNISGIQNFTTQSITNSLGVEIVPGDDEISITNISGFNLGSNGTDENSLRSAIGYNHGVFLLFDNQSYTNFISKYSSVLLQKILLAENKQINNLYISKKQSILDNNNLEDYKKQYKYIIENKTYLFSEQDIKSISSVISEYEYALSSHNLFHSEINNYALQITLDNQVLIDKYKSAIETLIYKQFSIFFYQKNHLINLEKLFAEFIQTQSNPEDNLKIEYILFNQEIEEEKYKNKTQTIKIKDKYIIQHKNKLPLLNGKFYICNENLEKINLFFDINFVSNS